MTKWMIAIALLGCSSKKEDQPAQSNDRLDMADLQSEAAVEFAEKTLPDIDKQLASTDPGAASSACAVIKPDLKKIRKAKPDLAATLEKRCGRDLAVRSLENEVVKIEKDPHECPMVGVYEKMVVKAGATEDPDVVKLHARLAAVCPAKK